MFNNIGNWLHSIPIWEGRAIVYVFSLGISYAILLIIRGLSGFYELRDRIEKLESKEQHGH
jgi:hypothetical protein